MNVKNNIELENFSIPQHPDYKNEIIEILRGNLTPKITKERILEYHKNDIADAMEMMNGDERKKLYTVLDTESLSSILEYSECITEYIDELSIRKKVDILSNIETSLASEYLRQTEKTNRKNIIDLMDESVKAEIKLLNSFDEDEIGSKMTTNFISVKANSSIKEAMSALVSQAADNDNITTLYVLDEDDTLLGAIDLKKLITAREGTALSSITMTSYPYVYANELIEDCITRIRDYSEDSIPVLDSDNKLKGVLLSQDITDLIGDIMGDDYAKLAGLSSEEDLKEPIKKSVSKRLPWLIILLGLGLLVSSVVGLFENVVSHLTLIVCFQSLILGMAGNAGTQSLAVTIRVLMDENLSGKQKMYLIGKETRVGLINGLLLGILSFLLIGAYIILFKGENADYSFSVSLCTGIAMLVSITLSSITGTVIPIIFKKLKVDPAVASGPLITTINDLVAIISYYGLALILLINIIGL